MQLAGRTWSASAAGYAVEIQRLDDAERQTWLRHATGSAVDPFLAPADQPRRFETFLVRVENRDAGPATFNPQDCWLVTTGNEVLYPLGLEDLAASYRQLGLDLPPAYASVGPALLSGSALLDPGATTSGLLVYPPFKPKTSRFRVDLQVTLASGDVVRLSAPYRRQPE